MQNSYLKLTDRIALSVKNELCLALHLEQGAVYEFELPFFEWLESLSLPRTRSSLVGSLPFASEEAEVFLQTLVAEGLLKETAESAKGEMPLLAQPVKAKFKKIPFQASADREWQREVVFATITVASL